MKVELNNIRLGFSELTGTVYAYIPLKNKIVAVGAPNVKLIEGEVDEKNS